MVWRRPERYEKMLYFSDLARVCPDQVSYAWFPIPDSMRQVEQAALLLCNGFEMAGKIRKMSDLPDFVRVRPASSRAACLIS